MAGSARRWRVRTGTLAIVALAFSASIAVATAPGAAAGPAELRGRVLSGDTPLASLTVTLFSSGAAIGGPAEALATASTDADGAFALSYEAPLDPSRVVYVVAEDRTAPERRPVVLASVLGASEIPGDVVVNERTTVATAYAMAQFTVGGEIAGPAPGITNAAGMAQNLVDAGTGELGSVLTTSPNGSETSTVNTFNSLANMVAGCVRSPIQCEALLDVATPPGASKPPDSFAAVVDIARNPSHHAAELFAFSQLPPAPYAPARDIPPSAWMVALRFNGDGTSMSGPGNFAIDHRGNIWVTANYEFNADPRVPVCGSQLLLKFSPTGQYVAGSPYTGGGLSGAGFGIDIDKYGDVWVGNFGFAAPEPGCPADLQPPHNSVSQFTADGRPVSSDTGFTQGGINFPQGTVADPDGNIWVANCGNDTLTRYAGGDPNAARVISGLGISEPFDNVDNRNGHVFVTGVTTNNVAIVDHDGNPVAGSPVSGGGLDHPLGIAADSRGNVWVANSGAVTLPCPDRPTENGGRGSLTFLGPNGELGSDTAFTGGGLTLPWGIAVDGNDNVWVANFAGKRLSQFCGSDPSKCPAGASTGDAISPATGYDFDGLVRNTGVAIDPSGNVWVANNWLEIPLQTNPGGHEIVAFVGAGGPVQRAAPVDRPVPPLPPEPPPPRPGPVPATPVLARPNFTG